MPAIGVKEPWDRERPPPAILIVNDREAQQVAIRTMLAPLGLTVVEADSGRAALRAVLRQSFALILMDVVSGVEALVRWRHPLRGLLMPGSFMAEVESTELIEPVTRWVLNEALHQQHLWREHAPAARLTSPPG